MNLLVTTSYSILELSTDTCQVRDVHRGDGLYFGITRSEKHIFVAARKRMVSSKTPTKDERGEILIFDLNLNLQERLQAPFPLRDLHQIVWHSETLWMTCSYDNAVIMWDGQDWHQWFPLGETIDGQKDVHHYNSLFFEEDLIWLLAHKRGPSELLAFSIGDYNLKKKLQLGNQSHNIWREGGQLYTCSSATGKIVGNKGFEIEIGGFLRGYVSDGNERCVGISELAERKNRDLTTGKVNVYNKSWNLIKQIDLPGEGLVLDFLCF